MKYLGDDFILDSNWQLFRKYRDETSRKLKVLQERDRRKNDKTKTLEDLIATLKDKKLISRKVVIIMEVNEI